MTDAELRDHGVNGADLQPGTTTSIAQLCSVDVILPVRSQERQGRKPVNDVFTSASYSMGQSQIEAVSKRANLD